MKKTLSFLIANLHKDFLTFCNQRLQEIGLTQGLMHFILYIHKYPNCSPGQLAQALQFDAGHTARSLNKLEEDGLVLRMKNPNDKRAYCLCLTPTGDQAMEHIQNLLVDWDKIIFSKIDKDEQNQLLRTLETVTQNRKSTLDIQQHEVINNI